MKNESKKIVFFGSGPVAAASLEFLVKHFSIEGIITKSVPAHHKGLAPVEELTKKLHIPVYFANTKLELDNLIDSHKFNSQLGILVDYGVIVSQKTIDSFELGIINSHFSLLPEWRGADPITFSILSGQEKTGVSLMLIEPTLDTGKLLTRKSLKISSNETAPSLTDRLVSLSNILLKQYVSEYVDGLIKPKKQPHPDRATYSRKLTKNDGIIDWEKPATQIEREIRAFQGWPRSRSTIDGKEIIITKAHVSSSKTNQLDILCGDNKYLSIDELIAPSGRTMSAKAYINGYF